MGPVTEYTERSLRAGTARAHATATGERPPLVEREAELATLEAVLEAARRGQGRLVLIDAATGIGKTRLLEEVTRRSTELGMRVLAATGDPLERDFAMGAAVTLLRGALPRDQAHRDELLTGAARLARQLVEDGAPPGCGSDATYDQGLLHGIFSLLARLADEAPIVLCLDDAQWADAHSLRALSYLARRIAAMPIAIVVATQSAQARADDLLGGLAAHPLASVLLPAPLGREGTGKLAAAVLAAPADESFASALYDATRGNPLLVLELLRELIGRRFAPSAASVAQLLDHGLEDVSWAVGARLARLDGDALALARAVATLGAEATARRVGALAGVDAPRAAVVLDGLVASGLLAGGEPLRFVHPVVRASLVVDPPGAERARAHLAAAQLLAGEGVAAQQVATHLVRGERGGHDWVVETLRAAGATALGSGDPVRAARYLRRALEEPPRAALRPYLVRELGEATMRAGEPDAGALLREAASGLAHDPRLAAETLLAAGGALQAGGRHAEAASALDSALDGLGQRDPELGGRIAAARAAVVRLGLAGVSQPEVELDADVDVEALARSGSGRSVLAARAYDAALAGHPREQVRELAERALGEGALLADVTADGMPFYLAVMALIVAEELASAEAATSMAVEEARVRGSVPGCATASCFRALAVLRRGRVQDAAADAGGALAGVGGSWVLGRPLAHGVLGGALFELGQLDEAGAELQRGTAAGAGSSAPVVAFLLAARGQLRLVRGDALSARDDLLAAGRRLAGAGALNPALLGWRSGAALACAQLAETDRAVELAEEELRLARSFGAAGAVGIALRGRALVEERTDTRIELLEQAVTALDTSVLALDRARALTDLGTALLRDRHRREAREPLALALDLADRCGATALAARAREELVAAGARPRRAALEGVGGLTPREHQVGSLAARGMRNREIAAALFLTVKTVEWHLANVFGKLALSSRHELNAALAGGDGGADEAPAD